MSNDKSPLGAQPPTPAEMIERQRAFRAGQTDRIIQNWLSELEKQTASSQSVGEILLIDSGMGPHELAAVEQFRQNGWTVLSKAVLGPNFPNVSTSLIFKARPTFDVNVPMPAGVKAPRSEE